MTTIKAAAKKWNFSMLRACAWWPRDSDPQMPPLLRLPQRDGGGLNGTPFLLRDPGVELFSLRAPTLADLETRDAIEASRFVPFVKPESHGANRESL